MNYAAKAGIVFLVIGFAFFGKVALTAMGPGGKVSLLFAAAAALLGGGIWLETKERYRLVGRTGIGGGWALLFFTTYAMHHVPAMLVMPSNTLNCILLLAVAVAMVAHTLRYRSQLVTGLAFLLAFSTVALSQDDIYSLAAGLILAIGIVAISLRMGWYELEVFGILASFGNHFYWLWKLYPEGFAGHAFPQFWASTAILIAYWLIFRISYVFRTIRMPRDEKISTIAALVNIISLLVVLKFQSTRPELAFYALIAIGALEFLFGQLPATRRRRSAFVVLSVLGTILIFASVPFKFSGNNIALFWMIFAEVLLIAGIAQLEALFRRLGLIAGIVTGLLILYEASHIVVFRQQSESPLIQDGGLLLTCSLIFYFNALFLRRRWQDLFKGHDQGSIFNDFDGQLADAQSYLGCIAAFLGVWALFTGEWTAVGWATLMAAAALGVRRLNDRDLHAQGWLLAIAAGLRALALNCQFDNPYPHRIALRLISLPLIALIFYGTAWLLSSVSDARKYLRGLMLWTGTLLLASLAWSEVAQPWVAPVWMALAIAVCLASRRLKIADLSYQEHVLAFATAFQLVAVNIGTDRVTDRFAPMILCAAALYAISRICTLPQATYRRPAAWAHTCAATALLAALAWHESSRPWLAVLWAVFALALAITDRIFDLEELPYQAHALALMAILSAVTSNLSNTEQWHAIDLRLITVSILAAALYAMARWVRMPSAIADPEARHLYSWAASGLFASMLWSELNPVSVALGIAIFGLLLFEFGMVTRQRQLRWQGYLALAAAFGRIFFVNLTASALPGETLSPRLYTVGPIALIYFFIWAQMQSKEDEASSNRWPVRNLIAYFGTGCITALLYYEVSPQWIVVSWAALVAVLMAAALLLKTYTFLEQASLLIYGIVGRGLGHNIFGGSYFTSGGWRGDYIVLSVTAIVLLGTLPLAFRLRSQYADQPRTTRWSRWTGYILLNRPEQLLFFAPVVLITTMIFVKMHPGMVTLSWGLEGVLVIVLGLIVAQRSYRLTGLVLLSLCVAKIVLHDAWQFDERDRYITFIVLGAALTLVSTLYGKYRDSLRRLL
jgi:hypothetical protein